MPTPLRQSPYILFLVLFCQAVLADTELSENSTIKDLLKYDLEDLMKLNVTTASRIPQTKDDAPAILTVVSEEEILNSGARDLIDVLRLVPGFDFGIDTGNMVGPMIRGNWAYEGGILILIDGLEMNERLFGTVQLGQRYPIDNIQRIEVMRGPGSVMYGGFARLGVINIITKGRTNNQNVKEKDELELTTRYGQTEKNYGHRGLSFYAGKNLSDDARLTFSGKASQAHRSDRVYTSIVGDSVSLAKTNQLENMLFNIGFQYKKDLSMRFILEDYNVEISDLMFTIPKQPTLMNFKSYLFDIKYGYDFTDALKLTFNFNYSYQIPWKNTVFIDTSYVNTNEISSSRYLGGARLDYALNKNIHITGGLDFSHEEFENLSTYDNNTPKFLPSYENISPYIESFIKTDWGNLTLGLRYDKHNIFQSNFSPRVAFTDTLGDFHYKLLYSNSFRTPTIGNYFLDSSHEIKPERTKNYEIELGYQLTKNLSLTSNAFYLSTKDKIIFGVVDNQAVQYNAHDKIETAGVETELRWKDDWGYLTFNHSYSQMINNFNDFKPIQQANNTLANSDMSLAFPAHKFTLNGHYQITPALSVNPSLIFTTSRYGYNDLDTQGNLVLHKYSPEVLGNVYFRYQDAFFKGLEIGLGVYNLFNTNQNFIQPYNGARAPLPGQSREVIFKVSYHL